MGGTSSQVLWKQALSPTAESTLQQALALLKCSVHELSSQQWDRATSTIGGVRDFKASFLAPASATWTSVILHLNSLIAEPLAAELSRLTRSQSLALLEYDQAAWGYCLFNNGLLSDRFWNIPEIVEMPADRCAGRADTISLAFGVPSESVAPYIRHIADVDYGAKAFNEDKFTLGDHWVRTDFIRRIGLYYPNPGQVTGGRYVRIEETKQ
jgi:hypothetical protein